VLAPEHPLVTKITTDEQKESVDAYIKQSLGKSEIERQSEDSKAKTGVFTGAYAINPANDEAIPIWTADYVLMGYGTGAVMGVPAHDDRDYDFAKKYDLEIRQVLQTDKESDFHSEGVVINSGKYDGMRSESMREQILEDFVKEGVATERVNYKIRDWLISRQRYWGAPIPIIHCPKHGAVAVPEQNLPVVLPELKDYQPTGKGSALAGATDWVKTICPTCGGPAERETDTMDGFACSSWYFLRFADPHNDSEPFSKEKAKFWLPVDDYIGGAEHAVMHLLYARMWTKVMHDAGIVDFDEPFKALRNQGMILAPDGRKMSKSWGNVIAPDEIISQGYGADSIRIMELFIGPWNQSAAWSVEGMGGCFRFLQRVWTITQEFLEDKTTDSAKYNQTILRATHKTTKKVTEDVRGMGFNTAISALMELTNDLYKIKATDGFADRASWQYALTNITQLLAPFAPHIAEELWEQLGGQESVHLTSWPTWDDALLLSDTMSIVVQVNGKLRANIELPVDATRENILAAAKSDAKVTSFIEGQTIRKEIYVPGKLVNLVV
jgi:leucyl-tRNA synthetase